MKLSTIAAAMLATALLTREVRADDARCISAYESTQRSRKAGQLGAARAEALVCSAASCPDIVVRDCAAWVTEIEAAMPTLVFVATSGDRELVDVEVLVDGTSMSKRLDGRAKSVDPGAHRVRFVAPSHEPIEIEIVVVEGEKNRKVSASFPSERAAAGPPAESDARPIPALVWLLGGVSAVAFTGSAIFVVDGLGRKSDLDALGCRPGCESAAVSATERSFVVADILAVAGIAVAAAAVVVYVTRPSVPRLPSASRVGVTY